MHKYLIEVRGEQKGPWSLQEILQNIQSHTLSWNDHIYDEKKESWIFLFEFPLLTEQFNSSFKKPVQKNQKLENVDLYHDRVWYILKVNDNYGPFTAADMIQMLQSKALFEFDFIWNQTQAAWKRLAEVPQFRPENVKAFCESKGQVVENPAEVFFRRKHARADYECELFVHNNKKVFSATSIEISNGGASFKIENADFKVGDQLHLHFKPGPEVPAFNATCKIVRRTGGRYGVQFEQISESARDFIDKFTKKAA